MLSALSCQPTVPRYRQHCMKSIMQQYLVLSGSDFDVLRHAGVTHCTNGSDIWHGRVKWGPKRKKNYRLFTKICVAPAHPLCDFYKKNFRDCGDLPMGHVLKFREIRSRGSRATGVLIWGGPFTPKHSVPPSSLRSPNVLHVQECARGTLSPCQVQWGLACHRGNQKCWVFCLSVCHVVSWKCGKIWGFCLSAAAWNSSLLKITPQVSSYMLTCVKCLLITVMYLFSWKCRPEVHMM